MANYTFSFTTSGLPSTFVGTVDALIAAWTASLGATISSSNVLLGAVQSSTPAAALTPWLDTSVPAWKVWNGTAYVPVLIKLGTSAHQITFDTDSLSANRTVSFQDKDGIVAYLDDVYSRRPTSIIPAGSPSTIDWSLSETFYKLISINQVFNMSNSLPGQEIDVIIDSTGTPSLGNTWNAVQFGTAPFTQTSGGKDWYHFSNIAGTIYGTQAAADLS